MKKIMFNDRWGLTQAVLDGRKTVTRRVIPQSVLDSVDQFRVDYYNDTFDALTFKDGIEQMLYVERNLKIPFHIQDEVAIAQSYKTVIQETFDKGGEFKGSCSIFKSKGLDNKMFVRAEMMPHRIKITGLRVEQLQDITDEDCIKEGVMHYDDVFGIGYMIADPNNNNYRRHCYTTARKAFADLIDKTCGKGTWNSNPWVLRYEFELIK